jgi:DNA polymerase-1
MSSDVVFGVDGNWYLHRVFHILKGRIDPEHEAFGAQLAKAFLAKVCVDALAVRATKLMVAFDGDAVFRYQLFPAYKANRGSNDEVYRNLKIVIKALKKAGVICLQLAEFEADDVLAGLARKYRKEAKRVVLGARDKDAYQYVRDNVILYDSGYTVGGRPSPRYLDAEAITNLTGLPPRLHVQYQALIGDGIDNVPKLVSPVKAKKGLLAHGSIKDWVAADPEIAKILRKNRKQLLLNRELVKLRSDLPVKAARIVKDEAGDYSSSYYNLVAFMNPKSKGLFSGK